MAEGESTIVIDESETGESKPHDSQLDGDDDESRDVMTMEQAEQEWNQLTIDELKEELIDRGLSTSGKKSDLVARLLANEFGIEEHAVHEECDLKNTKAEEEEEEEEEEENGDHEEEEHEEEQEGGDVDEENGEGVEFVEWNEGEDADHDLVEGGENISEEATGNELNESHEEEHKENEGAEKGPKKEVAVEEGDVKAEDGEYCVDVSKDKDLFYLNWHGKKIMVPFKGEIVKDVIAISKLQSVVAYPVELADIYSDAFRKYLEKASSTTLELEEMKPGKLPKGLLKLKFSSMNEALDAIEELKEVKEGVTVKHFCREDSESVILSQIRREECDRRGPTICRLLYVGNLPSHVTEASIKEAFPDALQVIIPYDEETMERTGYAYLEYANEEEAYEASEKYKDVELEGEKLYVIKAIAEKKEKYGLLRDTLRLYWVEQIQKFRKIIERSHGRPSWDVDDAEQKLHLLRRRLDKDKRRREELRLPIPDSTEDKKKKAEEKTEGDKERERRHSSRERHRSSHHSPKDSAERKSSSRRPLSRRSPFPRRDSFRSGRGGRGGYAPRSEEVANKLVNQLQGLVSALTNKLPETGGTGPSHPPHHHPLPRRHYPEEQRYGGGRPNYSRPSGYYDDHRPSGGAYHSSYISPSYDQAYPSYRGGYRENVTDRYSAKRYRDEDGYSPERKKRPSTIGGGGGYMNPSSSSRYPSSRAPYSLSNRRGGGAGGSSMSAGRQYGRSKPRGSYNY